MDYSTSNFLVTSMYTEALDFATGDRDDIRIPLSVDNGLSVKESFDKQEVVQGVGEIILLQVYRRLLDEDRGLHRYPVLTAYRDPDGYIAIIKGELIMPREDATEVDWEFTVVKSNTPAEYESFIKWYSPDDKRYEWAAGIALTNL